MQSPQLLIGTAHGVASLDEGMPLEPPVDVRDISRGSTGWWLVDADGGVWSHPDGDEGALVARHTDHDLHCVGEIEPAADVLVGASRATLLTVAGDRLIVDETFEAAEGRADWHTPWGGLPDVRSMSAGPDGLLYVNVHVGGILRRDDGGWRPTLDIDADVHQVVAHPTRPGVVVAATARGLAISRSAAENWSFEAAGLHATYSRAIALQGDTVFVSVSTGSQGRRAAVYRGELRDLRFERCSSGLPEWFSDNIDTKCIASTGEFVFVADAAGIVYRSSDQGSTWEVARSDLPKINAIDAG